MCNLITAAGTVDVLPISMSITKHCIIDLRVSLMNSSVSDVLR